MNSLNLAVQCLQLSFVSEPWDVPAGHTEDLDRTLRSPKPLQPDTIPWPALHINIDTVSVVLVLERNRSNNIWDCPNPNDSHCSKNSKNIFPVLLYTARRKATVGEKPSFISSWHTGSAQKQYSQSESSEAYPFQTALRLVYTFSLVLRNGLLVTLLKKCKCEELW